MEAQDMTACEFYGCVYQDVEGEPGVRVCVDCGDEYDDE